MKAKEYAKATRIVLAFAVGSLATKHFLRTHRLAVRPKPRVNVGNDMAADLEGCFFLSPSTTTGNGRGRERSSAGSNLLPDNSRQVPFVPLHELTRSNEGGKKVDCPSMMSPVYDRIMTAADKRTAGNKMEEHQRTQLIPKQIHVAWIRGHSSDATYNARCLPDDFVRYTEIWKRQFPSYSFYFHDDYAVDTLLHSREWPEFPHLQMILRHCLKFDGAVKIDVWRNLVLYAYGGIYTDLDAAATDEISEETIGSNDSAFFLSDTRNRPTQGCQGMIPGHPIAFNTLMQILTNLMGSDDVASIKPVFTTGPAVLKDVYTKLMGTLDSGLHHTDFAGNVRKVAREDGYLFGFGNERDEIVQWNETLKVTKRQRAYWLLQTKHWSDQIKSDSEQLLHQSCWRELYEAMHSDRPSV